MTNPLLSDANYEIKQIQKFYDGYSFSLKYRVLLRCRVTWVMIANGDILGSRVTESFCLFKHNEQLQQTLLSRSYSSLLLHMIGKGSIAATGSIKKTSLKEGQKRLRHDVSLQSLFCFCFTVKIHLEIIYYLIHTSNSYHGSKSVIYTVKLI